MAKKKPGPSPGGTPATAALSKAGIDFTTHAYDHDPATTAFGDEAAEALGVDRRRIFKTLIVTRLGRGLAVAVLPVAEHLDLRAMGAAIGVKRVELADPAAAQRSSGYVLGGISPIGQRTRLATVLDASALDFELIVVSAGRRGLQVELRPQDLVTITGAGTAPIVAGRA